MRRERTELLREMVTVRRNMEHALSVVERAIEHSDRSSYANLKFLGLMISHLYAAMEPPAEARPGEDNHA